MASSIVNLILLWHFRYRILKCTFVKEFLVVGQLQLNRPKLYRQSTSLVYQICRKNVCQRHLKSAGFKLAWYELKVCALTTMPLRWPIALQLKLRLDLYKLYECAKNNCANILPLHCRYPLQIKSYQQKSFFINPKTHKFAFKFVLSHASFLPYAV